MKHTNKSFIALLAIALLASSCSQKAEKTTTKSLPPIAVDAGKPHFTIAAGDLAMPAKVGTRAVGSGRDVSIFIDLDFSPAKAEELRILTRDHLQQQIQLLVGSNVVSEPFINSEIPGGHVEMAFGSLSQAQAVADALNKR